MDSGTLASRLTALLAPGTDPGRLLQYREDLLRFNRGHNLVSRAGGPRLVDDLIVECVAAASHPHFATAGRILDLGSGAGFPGIPLALVRPGIRLLLLERRATACTFLRRERVALGLADRVEIEEADSGEAFHRKEGLRTAFSLGVMKAVAPPPRALALLHPFLEPGGRAILFHTPSYRPEPQIPADRWDWEGAWSLPSAAQLPRPAALQVFLRL